MSLHTIMKHLLLISLCAKIRRFWTISKFSRTFFFKEVKMADNLGPMAWLFLPENEQVQYLQKIAQMRKKSVRIQAVLIPNVLSIFNSTQ